MNKNMFRQLLIFGILSFVMGGAAGAVVWLVLQAMNLGISFLWTLVPASLGISEFVGNEKFLIYSLVICISGGIIIGLWQRKYGLVPHRLEEVMARLKSEGTYPYDKIHVLALSALIPLIFGASIGPEAGLTGIIVAMCCLIGDTLKVKGDELLSLPEPDTAATLSVVFKASLARGIGGEIVPVNNKERERLVSKSSRIFLYAMGVIGGVTVISLLKSFFGGGLGIPRFDAHHGIGIDQWKWFVPMLALSVVLGMFYIVTNKITASIGTKLRKHRVTSCIIAGIVLAVMSYIFPYTMFSGEHDMAVLMEKWELMSPAVLITIALVKMFMVNMCVNLGWKGGSVFPIVFSGVAAGYAFASIVGMDGAFAVAVLCSGVYAYILKKPAAVVLILLLCFPVTYIIPMAVTAVVATKIPVPTLLTK